MNQKPLDKKHIEQHKDFDALMKRVESANASTENQLKVASKRIYLWAGGIAAALLLGFFLRNNSLQERLDIQTISAAYFAEQPYLNPPVATIEKQAATLMVDANEGGTYHFPSGSKMVVPKAAFANSYGALIEGEVEVHFKEYHDYVDFFLSGIPMEIKVDGQDGVLESAGMIEVYATQNGERLTMLPEKPIDIELKSQIAFAGETPPEFNIYYLDEKERAWDLRGKDKIELVDNNRLKTGLGNEGDSTNPDNNSETVEPVHTTPESLEATMVAERKKLDEKLSNQIQAVNNQIKLPIPPEQPELYDGNSMTMELAIEGNALAGKNYEGTIFEVLTVVDAFDDFSTTTWESFDLVRQADASFVLNLSKGTQQQTLNVRPVLVGQDYEKALVQFEAKQAEYVAIKQAVALEMEEKKKALEEQIAIEKAASDKSFEEKIAALKSKGHDNYANNEIMKRMVVNKFQISQFGIWNCDRPRPPYLANLNGTFEDQQMHQYKETVVYQTDKSQNTVRRFYLKDIANVQFNTESDNLLWLLTKENKLAVFRPEYFERIQQKDGDYAFELELNPKEINSEADVRDILRL